VKYGLVVSTILLIAPVCWGQASTGLAGKSSPPRRLSNATKNELAMCLKKRPGRFSIMSIANNSEAYRYAEDWRDVFISAGWEIDHTDFSIQSFRIAGGMWFGMRVRVHGASPTEGQTAIDKDSPEGNFAQCVAGKHEIPAGGRIITYKDRPTGSISIQISNQPQ
jgi:hypothetical protein